MNLDPFERFEDEKIWDALRMAHLEPFVVSLPDRLEHMISESGQNLRYAYLIYWYDLFN